MNRVYLAISVIIVVAALFFGAKFFSREGAPQSKTTEKISFELDTSEEAQKRKGEIEKVEIQDKNMYVHDNPPFSFALPEGYTVGQIEERSGQSIIVQNVSSGLGFQIFVSKFDEDRAELTEARIRQDLPSLVINNPQVITMGSNKGLAFVSQNSTFGTSREVWFVYNGYFYQMSTYLESEALLLKILKTFKIGS